MFAGIAGAEELSAMATSYGAGARSNTEWHLGKPLYPSTGRDPTPDPDTCAATACVHHRSPRHDDAESRCLLLASVDLTPPFAPHGTTSDRRVLSQLPRPSLCGPAMERTGGAV